jgi:hypothetical protein
VKGQGVSGQGTGDQSWEDYKKEATECAFKVVVQVRADRVWVGTYYGLKDATDTVGAYETFPRPADKSHVQCVARALQKASKWVPEDFGGEGVVVSDW